MADYRKTSQVWPYSQTIICILQLPASILLWSIFLNLIRFLTKWCLDCEDLHIHEKYKGKNVK